jgi:hypothetical protein
VSENKGIDLILMIKLYETIKLVPNELWALGTETKRKNIKDILKVKFFKTQLYFLKYCNEEILGLLVILNQGISLLSSGLKSDYTNFICLLFVICSLMLFKH